MGKSNASDRSGSLGRNLVLGFQHLFAMFGATVLVPLLTGLNPAVAVCTAGIGTLIFHWITGGKVPVFMGSSFAFVGVMVTTAAQLSGVDPGVNGSMDLPAFQNALPYVSFGIMCAGALYILLAMLVWALGPAAIMSIFPPVVTGPMIIVIGLSLAPTAAANITQVPEGVADVLWMRWLIAGVVIVTVALVSNFAKGFLQIVPIMFAIGVGYVLAILMGQVDLRAFSESNLGFQVPPFQIPFQHPLNVAKAATAATIIAPTALVTFMEHIGDITTNGAVTGNDFVRDPGLHRTLLGDGIATLTAGFLGGPANTTYSENTAVLATTGNYSPVPLRIAAVLAIALSFFGFFPVFLQSIPGAVMGGISLMLFGMIAAVGLRSIVEARLDFTQSRTLIIVSIMLTLGIGLPDGIQFSDTFTASSIFLSAFAGIVLNAVLPRRRHAHQDKI